jgi:hypothetical protein
MNGGAAGAASDLVAMLVRRNVRATLDPQKIQPPCIVVVPDGVTFDHLGGEAVTYKFQLFAVAPGARFADSLPLLDDMADVIQDEIGFLEATPGSIPFGDGELPAYVIPVTLDGTWRSEKP